MAGKSSTTGSGRQSRTKEAVYREQMEALGIYAPIFEPEIKTLCRIEREYTRAQKAWSATAAPGQKPSFLDPHWTVIQRLRAEILQHREALGLTPKALRKLTGAGGGAGPDQQDLISSKLDAIAARVSGYDLTDPFAGIPGAEDAAKISHRMDEELRHAVAEDMG